MGQGGEQIIHWETKEKILGCIAAVDRNHVIKHPDRVAEAALAMNGKTINNLCEVAGDLAEMVMYRQWHSVFLGFGEDDYDKDLREFRTEQYYFYNTVICNSEK